MPIRELISIVREWDFFAIHSLWEFCSSHPWITACFALVIGAASALALIMTVLDNECDLDTLVDGRKSNYL